MLALLGWLMLAFFLRFNSVFYQAQARYFMPATAPIALYLARPWARRDWPRWMRSMGVVTFFIGVGPMLAYMLYTVVTGSVGRLVETMSSGFGP
jgi:hypothetical protein